MEVEQKGTTAERPIKFEELIRRQSDENPVPQKKVGSCNSIIKTPDSELHKLLHR